MYYNITIFFTICCCTSGCIINAMDVKIFLNTIMLLKVNRFEGFQIGVNADELVINSMSVRNCNNYKLNK